jgi:hypothetical protein
MMDPKALEAWHRLMAEAVRGTGEGREALKSLAESPTTPDDLARWWARFMPAGVARSRPEAFEAWLEEWWKLMGVVPRSRYLELLERCELLRSRLQEAESTISRLRAVVGVRGQEQEARRTLDLGAKALAETLKAQTEWMRLWTARYGRPTEEGHKEMEGRE